MPQRRKLLQRRRQKDRDSRLLRRMQERRPRRKGRHSRSRRKGRLHSRLRTRQAMMNRRQAGNGRA